MERYLEVAQSATPPTAPPANPGYPTNGNPGVPIASSEPGEWWFHMMTEELRAVIVAAGITPSHSVVNQLLQALEALYSPVGYALLNAAQSFTKAQRGAYVALTSTAGSIAVDLSLSNNFSHTFTENTTLAAPTNVVAGQAGVIELNQHASSAKTLALNTFWKFLNGTVPSVSTTLSANQKLFYVVDAGGASATCVLSDPRS